MANAVWAAVPEPASSLTRSMKPCELPRLPVIQLSNAPSSVLLKSGVASGGAADVLQRPGGCNVLFVESKAKFSRSWRAAGFGSLLTDTQTFVVMKLLLLLKNEAMGANFKTG